MYSHVSCVQGYRWHSTISTKTWKPTKGKRFYERQLSGAEELINGGINSSNNKGIWFFWKLSNYRNLILQTRKGTVLRGRESTPHEKKMNLIQSDLVDIVRFFDHTVAWFLLNVMQPEESDGGSHQLFWMRWGRIEEHYIFTCSLSENRQIREISPSKSKKLHSRIHFYLTIAPNDSVPLTDEYLKMPQKHQLHS